MIRPDPRRKYFSLFVSFFLLFARGGGGCRDLVIFLIDFQLKMDNNVYLFGECFVLSLVETCI